MSLDRYGNQPATDMAEASKLNVLAGGFNGEC